MTETFVKNGDVAIATLDHGGDGPPVVLIHGAGRTLLDFSILAPLLTPEHRVIAMEVRGHGLTSSGPWTWDDVLSDVVAVIEQYALDRPAVVGHSLGGMFAAKLAGRPGLLSAAVNIDGHGNGKPEQYDGMSLEDAIETRAKLAALRGDAKPVPLTAAALAATKQAMVEQIVAKLALSEQDVIKVTDRMFAEQSDGTFLARPLYADGVAMAAALDTMDLMADYAATTVPLLVYNCTSSDGLDALPDWIREFLAAYRRGLAKDLEALAADHPLFSLQTMDATHDVHLTHAPVVADQVLAFLRSSAVA